MTEVDRRRGDRVVVAQLASLAALAWPGPARWRLPAPVSALGAALVAGGGGLALWAASAHGERLTPRVHPPDGARLLTEGPYAWSRHPVYAGLLAGATGVALLRRRVEPLLALASLAGVLHVKSAMEERALWLRFGTDYADYAARTPQLLGPRRG